MSAKARGEINRLRGSDPQQFVFQTFSAWVVIAAAMALSIRARFSLPVYLPAMFVIATRQNLLGLLVHEQAHFLGFRSKAGELFANLCCGYPLLISVDGYAKVHLSHHTFYFTEKDPDYLRKQGKEWVFPFKKRKLAKLFLKDAAGLNTLKTLKSKRMKANYVGQRVIATPAWVKVGFYGLLATVLSFFRIWNFFLLLWMLPLVTLFQIFIRWGALCEHKYNLISPKLEESTPLIKLRWWEALLFPNLNFTLHIYHHYFPNIPFSNLPKVHRIFQKEKLVNELNVFRGYGRYLHFLLREERLKNQFTPSSLN